MVSRNGHETVCHRNDTLPLISLHNKIIFPVRNSILQSIGMIGRDFLAYRADDEAIAEAFLLLPAPCLSRLSRSASTRGTVADHNIGLLCSPGVSTLWLRGRFTDEVRTLAVFLWKD